MLNLKFDYIKHRQFRTFMFLCLFLLSSFKSNKDKKFWVKMTYFINNSKIENFDSINQYFNFYGNGNKTCIENKTLDLLTIDSMIFQYDNLKFNIEKKDLLDYYDSSFIDFFENDTHYIDLKYFTSCSKCLNEFVSENKKLFGVSIDGLYIYRELY